MLDKKDYVLTPGWGQADKRTRSSTSPAWVDLTFQMLFLQVEGSQELHPDKRHQGTGRLPSSLPQPPDAGSCFVPEVTSPGIRLGVGEDEEGRRRTQGGGVWWWGCVGRQLLERNQQTRSFPRGRSDTWRGEREERDVCSWAATPGSALRP